jgi:hypothetical protein
MNLREEILAEHSRKQSLKIAGWIGSDKKRFSLLLDLFLHDQYRVVQRSAWVVSYVGERHPELVELNIKSIVNRLYDDNIHVAVKRNVIRILQYVKIPVSLHAKVINICMLNLADPEETVAVRCFSMTVLANLAKLYPEIKTEIISVLNSRFMGTTPGLKARAKKVIKELSKVG